MRRALAVLPMALLLPVAAGPSRASSDPSFLYVVSGNSQLYGFDIDPAGGGLTPLEGAPLPAGVFPRALAVAPSGPFAYAATAFPNGVLAFAANPDDGSLRVLPGSPFAVSGEGSACLAVDGLSRFLYVGNNLGDIAAYRIEPSGQLSAVPGQPFPAIGVVGKDCFASDPAGSFLYVVTGAISAALSVYRIDPATGGLTHVPGSPFPAEPGGNVVAIDPSGRFVYVANEQTENLSAYEVDRETGTLTPLAGSPFPAGPGPLAVTADPLGRFLFVGHARDLVSAFVLDAATGAPSPVPGSPFASKQPHSLFVESTGATLFAANPGELRPPIIEGGSVLSYRIDASTGALTLSGEFDAGPAPFALAGLGPASAPVPPDTTPPSIACDATPGVLWPPNRKLRPVRVGVSAGDDMGPPTVTLVSVASTQAEDPDDMMDWTTGTDDRAGLLRAERSREARTYTLTYEAEDRAGNTTRCETRVSVPANRGR
jgi:6-phosphogluconolactonase (cycloisomerase 2 family)